MLGYANVDQDYLSDEDLSFFRLSYCGLCHFIRGEFGQLAGAFVSYDAQFLALMIMAQRAENISFEKTRCPATAYTRKANIFDDKSALRFAAAITLLLIEEKLRDNYRDEDHLPSYAFLKVITNQINQSKAILEELQFSFHTVKTISQRQHEIEQKNNLDISQYLEPTSILMGELFAHTSIIAGNEKNQDCMRSIGRALGALVALTDACEDLANDIKHGCFNPILASKTSLPHNLIELNILANIIMIILEQLHVIRISLQSTKFNRFDSLIRNILIRGFPKRISIAVNKLWRSNHWIDQSATFLIQSENSSECPMCGINHIYARSTQNLHFSPTSPKSLWALSSIFTEANALAKDIGFENAKEYLFSLAVPIVTLSEISQKTRISHIEMVESI